MKMLREFFRKCFPPKAGMITQKAYGGLPYRQIGDNSELKKPSFVVYDEVGSIERIRIAHFHIKYGDLPFEERLEKLQEYPKEAIASMAAYSIKHMYDLEKGQYVVCYDPVSDEMRSIKRRLVETACSEGAERSVSDFVGRSEEE